MLRSKNILLFLFIINIAQTNSKPSKFLEVTALTAMGFTFLSTFTSSVCAFNKGPNQGLNCAASVALNAIATGLLVAGICVYCKRKNDQRIMQLQQPRLLTEDSLV